MKVTVWGEAPSVRAVKLLSTAQQIHAVVMSNPEIIPLDPSLYDATIPAIMIKSTPIHVFRSSESLKIKTPKMAKRFMVEI